MTRMTKGLLTAAVLSLPGFLATGAHADDWLVAAIDNSYLMSFNGYVGQSNGQLNILKSDWSRSWVSNWTTTTSSRTCKIIDRKNVCGPYNALNSSGTGMSASGNIVKMYMTVSGTLPAKGKTATLPCAFKVVTGTTIVVNHVSSTCSVGHN